MSSTTTPADDVKADTPTSTPAVAAENTAPSSSAPSDHTSATPDPSTSTASDATNSDARATVRRSTMPPTAANGLEGDDAAAAAAAHLASTVLFLLIEAPNGKTVKVETTPSDCILDVRQFLLECPETAEYTSYHLEASFGILNDYLELHDYPQLCNAPQLNANGTPHMTQLKIVPDLYDERAARLHVRKLRELLVKPPAHIQPSVIQAGYENVAPGSQEEKSLVAANHGGNSSGSSAASKSKNSRKKGAKKGTKDEIDEFADVSSPSSNASSKEEKVIFTTFTDSFSLHSFQPASKLRLLESTQASLVDAVRHISFSGWNPPPGNRKLQGDLLYLELITAEGTNVHVTSNQEGFFVNQSTNHSFNPEQAQPNYKSLTLVELLKKISPQFSQKWTKTSQRKITQHPFETMELSPANQLSIPWLAQAKPHTYDWNRSEDSILNTHGMDNRGVSRDWNEEYQSCRELPKSTVQERIIRDRTMYRVYSDFVDAATKGAMAVVHGHIPPVNPMDEPRAFVFIYNSIFFSFAVEGREWHEAHAGERVSYEMASQDLNGVKAYAALDIDDLYTLATVLIDYRGHRVIAQSIIPGIFHGEKASKHVYGSMDVGKTIETQPDFHALMLKASGPLHIKTHTVLNAKDEPKELAACVESKGIVGSDGRNYILDILRAFPRDANFLAKPKEVVESEEEKEPVKVSHPSTCLLRPELIASYCHTKAFAAILPSAAEQATKDTERRLVIVEKVKKAEQEAAEKKGSALTEEEKQEILRTIEDADIDEQRADIDAQYAAQLSSIKFNPDALTGMRLGGSAEEIKKDEDLLHELARYLKEEQLAKLMKQLRALEVSPVDTQHLTTVLHEHGINMRYLSHIIALSQTMHLPHIEAMCQQECIVRSAKTIFNSFLRDITPEKSSSVLKNKTHLNSIENLYFAPLIAKFLNSTFGVQAMGHKITTEQMTAAQTIVQAHREEQRERERAEAHAATAHKDAANEEAEESPAAESSSAPMSKGAKKNARLKKKAAAANGEAQVAARDLVVRLADGSRAPNDPLSPANLWTLIRMTVQEKYQYELPSYLPMTARSKLCMLRSFCIKTGVQLQCKDYDLAPTSKNAVPFTVVDVLDLLPVVKAFLPQSNDARELLESGKSYLQSGNFGGAYQLLSESLTAHHQVYGPMHIDTAAVYAVLALTCFQVGEFSQAIDFQQRAIIIYERVLGIDSYEAAHAHMHQALFLQQIDHIHASMKHMQRALYLFELIAGPNHPDTAAAHLNAAMLNQELGRMTDALKHLESALERNQLALGPEHAQVALTHHAVAVGHALIGDFRSAVMHEKMCKSILLTNLGPKEREVQRSLVWLEHFTGLAVKMQQTQNKILETAQAQIGKKGKNKEAVAAAAAAQQSFLPLQIPPAAIIPPQLKSMQSPLTWVNLHSQVASRNKQISMHEVAQILDATSKATAKPEAANPTTTTESTESNTTPSTTAAASVPTAASTETVSA